MHQLIASLFSLHFPLNAYAFCRCEKRNLFAKHCPVFSVAYLGKDKCQPKGLQQKYALLRDTAIEEIWHGGLPRKMRIQLWVRIVLFHRVWNMPVRASHCMNIFHYENKLSFFSSTTPFGKKKSKEEITSRLKLVWL